MTDHKTGGCLCGAVRYTLETAPTGYGACHCQNCRKFSGGIELGFEAAPGGATFEGTDHLKTYASSEWAERGFCDTCGSSLFWRMTAPGDMHGMMVICAGSLDSLEGLQLRQEVYIDHKPSGHALAGDHTRMTEAELLASVGITS